MIYYAFMPYVTCKSNSNKLFRLVISFLFKLKVVHIIVLVVISLLLFIYLEESEAQEYPSFFFFPFIYQVRVLIVSILVALSFLIKLFSQFFQYQSFSRVTYSQSVLFIPSFVTASLVYLYDTDQLLVMTLTYLVGLDQGGSGSRQQWKNKTGVLSNRVELLS